MRDDLAGRYDANLARLDEIRARLEVETKDALQGLSHVDRIYFRVKGRESFLDKALDPQNDPRYEDPLVEIEDLVAGRILVLFLEDIEVVRTALEGTFHFVESRRRRPARDEEFGYESHHLVCSLPPTVLPEGWDTCDNLPRTFELQIRTLFMHAWAEPQHDLGYKGSHDLTRDQRRELAWIAASAWGADAALQRIRLQHCGPAAISGRSE